MKEVVAVRSIDVSSLGWIFPHSRALAMSNCIASRPVATFLDYALTMISLRPSASQDQKSLMVSDSFPHSCVHAYGEKIEQGEEGGSSCFNSHTALSRLWRSWQGDDFCFIILFSNISAGRTSNVGLSENL